MNYLLIFFLDEGRTLLYGIPVRPSIQGIRYGKVWRRGQWQIHHAEMNLLKV
jgi:hypothetical protein